MGKIADITAVDGATAGAGGEGAGGCGGGDSIFGSSSDFGFAAAGV